MIESTQLPSATHLSDAQIAEASPKSTGFPAALAVVAALALVKPRRRIWEVATTHSQLHA